jgi:hypothetical protein
MQQTFGESASADMQDRSSACSGQQWWCMRRSKNSARGHEQPAALTRRGPGAGNMVLFDKDGLIKRYASAEHILEEFFHLRLDFYARRRVSLIQVPPHAVRSAGLHGRATPGEPVQASRHKSAAVTWDGTPRAVRATAEARL